MPLSRGHITEFRHKPKLTRPSRPTRPPKTRASRPPLCASAIASGLKKTPARTEGNVLLSIAETRSGCQPGKPRASSAMSIPRPAGQRASRSISECRRISRRSTATAALAAQFAFKKAKPQREDIKCLPIEREEPLPHGMPLKRRSRR